MNSMCPFDVRYLEFALLVYIVMQKAGIKRLAPTLKIADFSQRLKNLVSLFL